MRRRWVRRAGPLVVAVLALLAAPAPPGAAATLAWHRMSAKSSAAPTTLPITTVPPGVGASTAPGPTGTILMIKLYVGNPTSGERFYGAVFGARPAMTMGTFAQIVTFPKGGPGLVLLKRNRDDKDQVGGFIVQVPNLQATEALAVAHGARVEGKFAGTPGNQAARSIDLLDPWGNNVEILQLG
jgi:predicted enzyme related to lactoylglutathione lyase